MAQGNHKMNSTMSVSQVVSHASAAFFDDFYTPKNWFRSADAMIKQASIYEHEGDLQTAYFLLYRHAQLILEHLPKHPDARKAEYRQQWKDANRAAERTLAKLETLKPRINRRYERHQAKLQAARASKRKSQELPQSGAGVDRRDSGHDAYQLDAMEHQDVAVELADKEFGRQRTKAPSRQVSPQHEGPTEDLSSALLATGHRMMRSSQEVASHYPKRQSSNRSSVAYSYPSVAARDAVAADDYNSRPSSRRSDMSLPPPLLPSRPPKSVLEHPTAHTWSSSPPPLPTKTPIIDSSSPSRPTTPTPLAQFAPRLTVEGSQPLRPIFLPAPLRHRFLKAASANTSLNRETLALLAGTLRRGAFFITHLLLPPQTATSDTCEMTEQGEMVLDRFISERSTPDHAVDGQPERQGYDGEDLMLLGWIHTHPTQTCFLSSRDLHTHVWYQSSLPEAVAIVCAPSKNDWGAFRLTDPPGVGLVRSCKREGIFHLHDESGGGLYTDVVGGRGHVIEVESMEVEVVDLRGLSG